MTKEVDMHRFWFVLLMCALFLFPAPAFSQVSPEQRRELNDLGKQIVQVGSLIRRKDYDEAQKLLDDVEGKLQTLAASGTIPPNDRMLNRAMTLFKKQKTALEKVTGKMEGNKSEGVSFMKDIAPLIDSRCVQCHGEENPRNGLRLDRFVDWRKGGKGGPLLIPGNSLGSLIMLRVNAPEGKGRMPQRGNPLTSEEKAKFSDWIDQGAKFDGASEDKTFADLIYEEESKNVKIPRSKGTEQTKFTRDIAPWFTTLCLRCHNSQRKSGGLSVETFYDIMKGGDSGEVVIPGDMENSRMFLLVGGKELPRMPQGQALLTRENFDHFVEWFREGNTFDGTDPRAKITSYAPSPEEMATSGLSAKTAAEMEEHRESRSAEQYRKALSGDPTGTLKTPNFLLVGNVAEQRLKEVQSWADEQLQTLEKAFNGAPNPWRGRLAIFVLKDQFSYSEFLQVVERKRPDQDPTGHSKVTTGQEDAYVVLQDVGDSPAGGVSLRAALIENLTAAYLNRSGTELPGWVTRGAGLAMADAAIPNKGRSEEFTRTAGMVAPAVGKPDDIFNDGTFSPSVTGAVGYTLVKYLLANGGPGKFSQFVQTLEGGKKVEDALQTTYGSSATAIARGYFSSLKGR